MRPMRKAPPHSTLLPLALIGGLNTCFAAELRPLSTDRPDTTESPHSVDAGHYQCEMELASWTRDGGEWTQFTLGELNAKYGLNAATDLQVVVPFHTHVRHGGEGFGDVEIRVKHNLWGNDQGPTALAVMPFVKLPTANGDLGNGDLEGGLIVPFGFDGPAGWSCAVMGEIDLASNDDRSGCHPVALASATASHEITECSAAFLELVSILSTESGEDWEAYFNTGMTWAVTPAWQLDGGIRVGLTRAATDFNPFLGVSTKF